MKEEKEKSTRKHKRGRLRVEKGLDGSFKRKVVLDYLEGDRDQRLVAAHYGLSQTTVCLWTKSYLADKDSLMDKKPKKKAELSSAEKELQALRKELEEERLKNIALQELIQVAEKNFNIPISKKPGAKQ